MEGGVRCFNKFKTKKNIVMTQWVYIAEDDDGVNMEEWEALILETSNLEYYKGPNECRMDNKEHVIDEDENFEGKNVPASDYKVHLQPNLNLMCMKQLEEESVAELKGVVTPEEKCQCIQSGMLMGFGRSPF